ncbi:MAG: glycosyltransferase family 2 protein [Bacteroidales bacterium]|nr:MAG: glycosyltransferase family 2 protein [Bacteroidales bacterium]
MLGFYLVLPFLLFALYRLFVVLYNYFTRPFLPSGIPADNPLASIIVYVQNSDKSIGKLIQGIKEQTHQNFEVLIYNDQSNDKTVEVITEISAGDKRFRLFNGGELNTGWQNKNYAYDKLVQIAKGQYYIFVDSDNFIDSQFVANAISHMQRKSLSLLMLYPKLYSHRFWTRMQISATQWVFLTLVYAKSFLIKRAGENSIFANPLLIAEATSYQSNRLHEKFKDVPNPEIKIADAARSLNLKCDSLLGDNSLTQKILNFNNELADFSSDLIKSRNGLIAYTIATTLGLFLAISLLPFPLVFLYLLALIYSQMLIAMINQQSIILSLLIMPIQYFVLVKSLIIAIKKSDK